MLKLDWNGDRFEISTSLVKIEDREEIVERLKFLYIDFDYTYNVWFFYMNDISENILWFKKYNIDVLYSDNAITKIKNITNLYKKELKINRKIELNENVLQDHVVLYDFQKDGINFILKRNRSYCADDAGSGKTVEILTAFSQWYYEGYIEKILIIVRSTLCYHWQREILNFSNQFKKEEIQIIDNDLKEKPFGKFKDKKILIISRDSVGAVFGSYKKDYNKTKNKKSKWRWKKYVNVQSEWGYKKICLVIDEAHDYSNPKAVRTKAILHHKDDFEYRIQASATPAINSFEKYHTAFKIMDESVFPMSYNAFKLYISKSIGDQYDRYNITKYDDIKIGKMKNIFSTYFIKRLKKDLPEMKTEQFMNPVYLTLTKKHISLYYAFIEDEVLKLCKDYDRITLKLIMNKFSYLLQIIDNPLLLKGKVLSDKVNKKLDKWCIEDDIRYRALKEHIEDCHDRGRKLIIFDNHPKTLNILADKFKKYNPLLLHGQTGDNREQRDKKIDLFNDPSNKYRLFFINPTVGGPGLNLNKGTNMSTFYTIPFDATITRQAWDRAWRINNTLDSYVSMFVVDNSIDMLRYNRNVNRIKLNDSFLNKSLEKEDLKKLFMGVI